MSADRSRRLRVAIALAGVLSLMLVDGGRADATATTATTTDPVQAAAGWLATQFEDSTHLPAPAGDHFDNKSGSSFFTDYGENADVIFGLAAAGAGKAKIATALAYLASNLENNADVTGTEGGPYDGSVAKTALAAEVAAVPGSTATSFGGTDLINLLKNDECTAATTPYDNFGDTVCAAPGAAENIFASVSESLVILAEVRGGMTPTAPAIAYLDSLQCASGGFTISITACAAGNEDIDATSYAIMAMSLLGAGQAAHLTAAVSWLHAQQNAAGYWVSQGVANLNSTGLAAAALQPQGVSVATARSWLLSQQVAPGSAGAGALNYAGGFTPTTTSATSPSVLATAQGLTGLVDGGSLATASAANATNGTSAFAPVAIESAGSVAQGGSQTVTATGFTAGEQVQAVLHSNPVTVGSALVTAGGAVTISFAVPASVAAGAHTLTLTGLTSGLTVSSPLTVTAAAVVASPVSTSTSGDPLANTGLDGRALANLAALGLVSVLAGFAFLLAARTRRA
jgi:hypothetical protein